MLADGRTAERQTDATADHYQPQGNSEPADTAGTDHTPQTADKRHIREIAEPAGTDGRAERYPRRPIDERQTQRRNDTTAEQYQPQGNRELAEPQERTTHATADQYQPHGNRVLAGPQNGRQTQRQTIINRRAIECYQTDERRNVGPIPPHGNSELADTARR